VEVGLDSGMMMGCSTVETIWRTIRSVDGTGWVNARCRKTGSGLLLPCSYTNGLQVAQ
jgi:hypothetical protein